MTAIIGILCKDGVVMGADSSATFTHGNFSTIEQPTKKLHLIQDKIIIASTGEIGLGQRFHRIVLDVYSAGAFKNQSPEEVGKIMSANMIKDFQSTGAKLNYGALVALPINGVHRLYEFPVGTLQPELKENQIFFVSMGSGQPITDPFLASMREIFWEQKQPSIEQATFAITWTLDHVIQVNASGIRGPMQMAILECDPSAEKNKPKARILSDDELLEHKENLKGAKKALRQYQKEQTSE